jgi:hypothetical protein
MFLFKMLYLDLVFFCFGVGVGAFVSPPRYLFIVRSNWNSFVWELRIR